MKADTTITINGRFLEKFLTEVMPKELNVFIKFDMTSPKRVNYFDYLWTVFFLIFSLL